MNKAKVVFMGTPDFAVPALQALVEDGYNGFRFAPRDVDALADRLATVLTDEVLRKGLRGNVRRCVKENFDAVEGGVRFTRAILDASA